MFWYEKYYQSDCKVNTKKKVNAQLPWTIVLAPLNSFCFAVYCCFRAIWRLDIEPIFEIFGGFNPVQKCNLKRVANPNGGYQESIKNKFGELYENYFPSYYSESIMEELFPYSSSFSYAPENNIHDKEHAQLFSKYSKHQ